MNLKDVPEPNLARVYIHTLSPFSGYGSGQYKMSGIKAMSGSERFFELPDEKKGCSLKAFEMCRQKEIVKECANKCKCVPFELTSLLGNQVENLSHLSSV